MTNSGHIFISHTSADDAFVKALREKLEVHHLTVWVDSRNLRGGQKLEPKIRAAIQASSYVLAVLSSNTINSPWVRKEIRLAEQAKIPVIPLLLPPIQPSALGMWFDEEPVGVKIELAPNQLQEAMPHILAALGQRLPDDLPPETLVEGKPLSELLLELSEPELTGDQPQLVSARAKLSYIPANPAEPKVESKTFKFTTPPLDLDELDWYLEQYFIWPVGLFRDRGQDFEQQLPQWGQALYQAIFSKEVCREVLNAWQNTRHETERRVSVQVSSEALVEEQAEATRLAATRLQALPWELLHDGKSYLSAGANPIRIRRRLPNYEHKPAALLSLPIRILLVTSRPEDKHAGYIDHRASALPLVEAVASLGELVELHLLTPATKGALQEELQQAREAGKPYHVLHFDGHGVYDAQHGLGALCFEHPDDSALSEQRRMQLVYADELGALLRDYRIPLVFLEACQTAQADTNPNASVAATLLQTGISSVVAMTHSVLVETARRFVTRFYQALAQGKRVGAAMLAGQIELMHNTARFQMEGAGEVHLQDWFVPILYQEQIDPPLFQRLPSSTAQRLRAEQWQSKLGALPATPEHTFIGRSRELLKLERLLNLHPYVVIRGQGGMGKTTLAVELARWLVLSRRFERVAFVSVEELTHERAMMESLLQQLVSQHKNLADFVDPLQAIRRTLENERTVIVVDNMESLLADAGNVDAVLRLLQSLLSPTSPTLLPQGVKEAKLIFTSRESLPEPFNHVARHVELGELSQTDARDLVLKVMNEEGANLRHDAKGNVPEQVTKLIDIVGCHARALVLVGRELAKENVLATTERVKQIMQDLHTRFPNNRERSLFASVELSLRRLTPEVREQIKGLAVLRDGGNIWLWQQVLGVEEIAPIIHALQEVGLAHIVGNYNYIRLDPALSAYLQAQITPEQQQPYEQRWVEVMGQLVDLLYEQKFQDAPLAAQLTQLELPNLLAYLQYQMQALEQGVVSAELVADQLGRVEQLLAELHQPYALQRVVNWREQVARQLGEWSHARFEQERMTIKRLMQQGNLPAALKAAQSLLQQCEQAGAQAYQSAAYDWAMANVLLGQGLSAGGAVAQALPYLQAAQQGFEALGKRGTSMAAVALTEQGDCLQALGQLDAAAAAYEERIKRGEQSQNRRGVAVGKAQLATTRYYQKRYTEALQAYQAALQLFESLNEPKSVATILHQIGILHKAQGNYSGAEQAYRQSLALTTKQGNRAGEANSLSELGSLNAAWQRPEQAVSFYRQALAIYRALGNVRFQGFVHNNLAQVLVSLKQYEAARVELHAALNCKQDFGHAAEPWKTLAILYELEQACGDESAAKAARAQAVQAYLAYRRDGGENHFYAGRLCLTLWEAMQQGEFEEAHKLVDAELADESWGEHMPFIHKLQAMLVGERGFALAEDENLHYQFAVELLLLLERLREAGI